jgi:hypothetical protein
MDVRGVFRHLARRPATGDTGAGADGAVDVAMYKYLLRVASPHVFEQVHVDAFTRLPDDRREAVWESMRRDLPEEGRPASADPADLARSAAWAQDDDPGYLLRILRRPGHSPATEGPDGRHPSGPTLYAASVLGAVAAAAAASPAAAETLKGFSASLEAAQVDPTHFVPRPGMPDFTHGAERPDGWMQ